MWKRTLTVGPNFFLGPIDELNKLISYFFIFAKKHEVGNNLNFDRDISGLTVKIKKPHIFFIEDEKKEAKFFLSKFGLGEDDKFVCLSVRDSAYHDKYFKDRNWDYHNFRNGDINNYLPASEFLADQGYFVFRMGKAVNLAFKSKNPRIIDYANSKYRSDLLDIYLGANCEFCISSSMGYEAVPYVFRKPIVLIPHTLGYLNTYYFNSLALPRPYFYSKEKRYLSMQEIFDMGIGFSLKTNDFKSKDIVVEENTKEQIQEITEEMIQRLNGKWKETEIDKQNQIHFIKKFKNNLKTEKQKKLHGKFYIKIGSKFLKNNLNWLYN
jgi:putative glycosyltransferase (TIGR04372 family)